MRAHPVLFAVVLLAALYLSGQDDGVREAGSLYSKGDAAKVPLVFAGLVTQSAKPVAAARYSWIQNCEIQLFKAQVRIENVLQGNARAREDVDVFFYHHFVNIGGSQEPLYLRAADRKLFFLMKEAGHWRTICDQWGSCCVVDILAGKHSHWKRDPSVSIDQAVFDFLYSRGDGTTDEQMLAALDYTQYVGFFGKTAEIHTLQRLAKEETLPVRREACRSLDALGSPCQ